MPANIAIQLAQLSHDAVIELFEIDATIVGGNVLHFHNGTNQLGGAVVWQGVTYQRFSIEVTGFNSQHDGPAARPKLRASNVLGLIGALAREYKGLKDSKFTRRRTLAKYLDALNFPGGVNPTADPTSHYADDVYFLDRQAGRNKLEAAYELASPLDLPGKMLPGRQIMSSVCPGQVIYRGPDCGYTGPPVARADDTPTVLLLEDRCGHRLSSCRLRQWPNNELAFGGFPGAGLLRDA